jgi:hypothetical protein
MKTPSRLWLPVLAAMALLAAGATRTGLAQGAGDLKAAAALDKLFLHDPCTGEYPPQPDTCLHKQLVEKAVTFGGKKGVVYDVRLRIRGIVEPTTIAGGEAPDADHPYYIVGGAIRAKEWSAWHIDVSEPKQTYWLNHYPKVGHIIYLEDFEATIPIAGGASVVVRVIDGNDRQIDTAEPGKPDRQQVIKGIQDKPLDGQMLRLDVIRVTAK